MNVSTISYVPTPARIAAVVPESDDTRTFVLDLPERSLRPPVPGQFVMLSVLGHGEAAFSVSSLHREPAVHSLSLTVRRVGDLTSALFSLAPGASVGLRGPYGRGFPDFPPAASVLFVAGGCGLAPLRPAIERRLVTRAADAVTHVVYGAHDPGARILRADLERWRTQEGIVLIDPVEESDPHWTGARGDVASALACALAERIPDRVAACGPPGMLAAVARKLRAVGVAGEHASFAIERQMKCALGICGRCYAEDSYVCREGPVFTLAELDDIDPTVAGHA